MLSFITGLMKIVDNVYNGMYYRYFGGADESMMNDDIGRRMTSNDTETMERVQLIRNLASSERRRTDQNMLLVVTFRLFCLLCYPLSNLYSV